MLANWQSAVVISVSDLLDHPRLAPFKNATGIRPEKRWAQTVVEPLKTTMMRKGQTLVVGNVAYDPDKIAHFDFGKNQFGQRRCRCAFNEPASEGEGTIRSKEEYGLLLEFAETNALIREREVKFRE